MRNPNINKVTLKAVKTHRVEEKNIFALVFFFFLKTALHFSLFMQCKSTVYFVTFCREENYWTYADSHKLKRWLFLPPGLPLTLD